MTRLFTIAALLGACSSSSPPKNVAGDYSVNVVDRANGCNLSNWTEGQSSTGISVTVTQSGATAQVTINGAVGVYVNAVIGGQAFDGAVAGADLDAALHGTRQYTMGNCAYTYTADLAATLTGDTLAGTITYTPMTNGSPDCGTLASCQSVQDFNGLRPPT